MTELEETRHRVGEAQDSADSLREALRSQIVALTAQLAEAQAEREATRAMVTAPHNMTIAGMGPNANSVEIRFTCYADARGFLDALDALAPPESPQ